jgi:cation transport regulator
MPYKNLSELPRTIRGHLPRHAQTIYLKAFNNAWIQYAEPRKRRNHASREETAHKVAWGAVERLYEKRDDGRWYKK